MSVAVNQSLEEEVEEYEERYRGRELPGFINYKTFEFMVKEQIKELEEPAVRILKDVGGIRCSYDAPNLLFWSAVFCFNHQRDSQKAA